MTALHNRIISVIGLGYVGLPLATAFGKLAKQNGSSVIAFDINPERIAEIAVGHDRTGEVRKDELRSAALIPTTDPDRLRDADFHIVTVPTPINSANRPDLTALHKASATIAAALKKGDIVVYESTVFPGATEEECLPILESLSRMKLGRDFGLGYSPERINPGDQEHRFETITKVVSANDEKTLDIVAEVYGSVVKAGIHKAPDIRTAEAAKVIENTQRDLNIALMNELAVIFHRLGIDTHDVLAAAGTKWNFLKFSPGLVGGHCIGVDPYYLTHRAEQAGYTPEVILAGRRINNGVGPFLAHETIKRLMRAHPNERPIVTVLGLTFKEDVPDLRNSKSFDVLDELAAFGADIQAHDPLIDAADVQDEYPHHRLLALSDLRPAHAVILAVRHRAYREGSWALLQKLLQGGRGLVVDVRAALPREGRPQGIELWRL